MRTYFLMFALLLGFNMVSAQTIIGSVDKKITAKDSVQKRIFDNAKWAVTYEHAYLEDSRKPQKVEKGLTLLQVGDNYCVFKDYYNMQSDSMIDDAARHETSFLQVFGPSILMLKKVKFSPSILLDRQANKLTVQDN